MSTTNKKSGKKLPPGFNNTDSLKEIAERTAIAMDKNIWKALIDEEGMINGELISSPLRLEITFYPYFPDDEKEGRESESIVLHIQSKEASFKSVCSYVELKKLGDFYEDEDFIQDSCDD